MCEIYIYLSNFTRLNILTNEGEISFPTISVCQHSASGFYSMLASRVSFMPTQTPAKCPQIHTKNKRDKEEKGRTKEGGKGENKKT